MKLLTGDSSNYTPAKNQTDIYDNRSKNDF